VSRYDWIDRGPLTPPAVDVVPAEEVVLDPVPATAPPWEVRRAGDLHWGLYQGDALRVRALERDEAHIRGIALKLNDYDRMVEEHANKMRTLDAKIAVRQNAITELANLRAALAAKLAEGGEQ
jgi:hypothetical protein